ATYELASALKIRCNYGSRFVRYTSRLKSRAQVDLAPLQGSMCDRQSFSQGSANEPKQFGSFAHPGLRYFALSGLGRFGICVWVVFSDTSIPTLLQICEKPAASDDACPQQD